jgi:hypothetical protein
MFGSNDLIVENFTPVRCKCPAMNQVIMNVQLRILKCGAKKTVGGAL